MVVSGRSFLLSGLGVIVLTILGNVSGVATPAVRKSPVDRIKYPAVAAHRGGRDTHPEGSMTAFRTIVADHPGMVLEMDVRPLKDGTLVVCHDATVDRIAAGGVTGKVADMSVGDWGVLRVHNTDGAKTGPAAFLADVLTEYGGTNVVLCIELKDYSDAARNEYVRQCWPYRDQIISACFDTTVNRVLSNSGFHGQHLTSVVPAKYQDGVTNVCMKHSNITPEVVADVHALGLKLWAWTVNDTATKDRLYKLGVDGIITDNPDT